MLMTHDDRSVLKGTIYKPQPGIKVGFFLKIISSFFNQLMQSDIMRPIHHLIDAATLIYLLYSSGRRRASQNKEKMTST